MHMRRGIFGSVGAVLVLCLAGTYAPVRAADDFTMDPMHSSLSFKIAHLGLSQVHGRFNAFSGGFTIDPDNPGNTSFSMTIKTESVDTNNKGRDNHLRSPDFFNAKQFPELTFKSTSIRPVEGGYEVTGDLTMHGQTKPITLVLKGGASAEFPQGTRRTGYSGDVIIKRSDFGVGNPKFAGALGEDVSVSVSFEGTKK
jgi:polyisoprenoid-binding protein YceI